MNLRDLVNLLECLVIRLCALVSFSQPQFITSNLRAFVPSWPVLVITLFLFSCDQKTNNTPFEITLPDYVPVIPTPDDNNLTFEKIDLGKKLFFDKTLSSDSTISCASCHMPQFAFSDTVAFSKGVNAETGNRNSPTLTNVAYNSTYFWDGGAETLELQLNVPFTDHVEMNMSYPELIARLEKNNEYRRAFIRLYDDKPTLFGLTRSLASYQRTLLSFNSKYDHFVQGDSTALNKQEIAGMILFFSERTQCSTCHVGFNFTDNSFHNIGLYEEDEDYGRMRITTRESDFGKFKTPTLRNVALTAPYMHDGSLETLAGVIDHFNSGGKNNPRKSALIKPMGLSHQEKENLIAFLNTLTDYSFIDEHNETINH